jgi:hypothetical protein
MDMSMNMAGGYIAQAAASTPYAQTMPAGLEVKSASQTAASQQVAPSQVEGFVDRVRGEFEAFRARLATTGEARSVNTNAKQSVTQELTDSMNASLRMQMQIFELSVMFNAGLTIAQQSQGSVKTLIEKG